MLGVAASLLFERDLASKIWSRVVRFRTPLHDQQRWPSTQVFYELNLHRLVGDHDGGRDAWGGQRVAAVDSTVTGVADQGHRVSPE